MTSIHLVRSTFCTPMHVCTHASLSGDRDLYLEMRAITKNTKTGTCVHTLVRSTLCTQGHTHASLSKTETCIWKCELLRNIRRLVRPHISPIHVMCTDARLYTCKSLGRPRLVFGSASYYEKYRDWCVHTYQSTRSKSNMNSTDLLLRGWHPFF